MPHLAGEGATGQDVLHALGLLVAEDATVGMRGTSTGEAVRRPAPVLKGEPDEDLDAQGGPGLPLKPPMGSLSGAEEERVVARFGRVFPGSGPTPPKLIRGGREGGVPQPPPKIDVLNHRGWTKSAQL